jgi:hypothetical protein
METNGSESETPILTNEAGLCWVCLSSQPRWSVGVAEVLEALKYVTLWEKCQLCQKKKTRLLLKESSSIVWEALKGATGARSKSSPTFYKRWDSDVLGLSFEGSHMTSWQTWNKLFPYTLTYCNEGTNGGHRRHSECCVTLPWLDRDKYLQENSMCFSKADQENPKRGVKREQWVQKEINSFL